MSWVIVTGANGGIGAATVHELIKNNYSVYAADLADKPHESFAAYGDAIFRYRSVNVKWMNLSKAPSWRRESCTVNRS